LNSKGKDIKIEMKFIFLLTLALFVVVGSAEIFFSEEFGEGWENRWVLSTHKKEEAGNFIVTAGKYFGDVEAEKGLKTGKDARFYQISAEMKEFNNQGDKPLVIQYSVKHEQGIDCGGAYMKLLPAGLDQTDFSGDSPYNIMFGPDICGNTKRVHVIFNYNAENHLIRGPDIKAETDEFSHLYTLIVRPDRTFEVLVDNKPVKSGSLLEHWGFLPPKEIKDPSVSKPADWVEEKEIVDPESAKPEGWDDIPKQLHDKDATRPADWDSDLDGEWEAPLIDNPEYKGEWKAPKIPNPAYKGEWVHPMISNPEYKDDETIGKYASHKYLGIEIWQVKSGTIFDNFLVTDDIDTAVFWAQRTLKARDAEKAAQQKEKEEKASENKGAEAEEGEDDLEGDGEALSLDDIEKANAFNDEDAEFPEDDELDHDEL
jgi:calreticulin